MILIIVCGAVTAGFFLGRRTRVRQEPPETPRETAFVVTANLNQTLDFGDALQITLTKIEREGNSLTPTVTASVSVKDSPALVIRKAEEGAAVTYPKEHGYTIRILKIEAESARFSIVKDP